MKVKVKLPKAITGPGGNSLRYFTGDYDEARGIVWARDAKGSRFAVVLASLVCLQPLEEPAPVVATNGKAEKAKSA